MNIRNSKLNEYIYNWDRFLKWKKNELSTVREILKSVSLDNGGNIDHDTSLDLEIEESYVIKTIDDAINKVMNLYTHSIKYAEAECYYVPLNNLVSKFDFLGGSTYLPKLDLNTATTKELEELPGIGPIIANRIKDYRKRYGSFDHINDIIKVKGIGERTFERIKYALTIATKSDVSFFSPQLLQFKKKPSFKNYIKILKTTEGAFIFGREIVSQGDTKVKIIRELKKIRKYIRRNSYPEFGKCHKIRASKIKEDHNIRIRANEICNKNSKNLKGVTVIDDTAYLYFVTKALSKAKKRIYIIMFFMRFEEEGKYPTDDLIEQLVQAKQRGVNIKIVLDKDAEGEVYGSRIINQEVYRFFKKQGIEVVFDFEDKVTHSKVVIIDDKQVIIGSHNWTAGSFFAYDDKSLYIESREFNKLVSDRFLKLWHTYTADITTTPKQIDEELILTLSAEYIQKLAEAGINNTLELLESAKTLKDRAALSSSTGIPPKVILNLAKISDLMRVKGVSEKPALMLSQTGVETVPELAQRNPRDLYSELRKIQASFPCFPMIGENAVSEWIDTAKRLGAFLEK